MTTSLARRTLMSATFSAMALSPPRGIAAPSDASGAFARLEVASGGRLGVAAVDTGTGSTVTYRAEERFPMCSTFKVLAAIGILRRSATTPELLARRITFSASDFVPYSPITGQHAETGMTVGEICAAALQYSDNTAGNAMIRLLGGPADVTAVARSIGDGTFRLDRWETALNSARPGDARDTSTPIAMLTDLRGATLGSLLGPAERAQLVTWMKGCTTGADRIRAAAPPGAEVANKTGSGDNGTASDIAVVWPPAGAPRVIAVYVRGQTTGSRDTLIARTAKVALEALGG